MIAMIDLHTHILPGMDDGAPDVQISLELLQQQLAQGVDTVALTPHFYRTKEHISEFLQRRTNAMAELTSATKGRPCPHLVLGAEVAWMPGMADWPELEELCYTGTKNLLVELPFIPWQDELFRQLYSLEGRRGITPVLAHVERYADSQSKKQFRALLELGFPMQISGSFLTRFSRRRLALRLLQYPGSVLISDCHDPNYRPPILQKAMAVVEKKSGADMVNELNISARELLDEE